MKLGEFTESNTKADFTQVINIFAVANCPEAQKLGSVTANGVATFGAPGSATVNNGITGALPAATVDIAWGAKTMNPTSTESATTFAGLCAATHEYELTVGQENNIDAGCLALGIPPKAVCGTFYHVVQLQMEGEELEMIYSGEATGFTACAADERTDTMDDMPYEHVHDEDDSASTLYGSALALAAGLVASFYALH
eukprot:CAMPEP_0197004934 /NCGR_PEP_ID=MMETSP1380-20130617/26620_1 /TAXON_ID=5936 /ORGANISM="Euplotes crassus, Strain CT5" /LENGTH=196 /DNA_ID=CAMNT_0042423895 /DNA_START=75 /DNA_END=665 /DNA_ORIENTATION=+